MVAPLIRYTRSGYTIRCQWEEDVGHACSVTLSGAEDVTLKA
jgi:hypothetical protein